MATKTWTLGPGDWTAADASKIVDTMFALALLQHSSDDAFGSALDTTSIYTVSLGGTGSASVSGGELVTSAPANTPVSFAVVSHKTMRFGDFDYQVDFGDFAGTAVSGTAQVLLNFFIDANNQFGVIRARTATPTNYYQSFCRIAGTYYYSDTVATVDVVGKFRITRSGTTVTLYYWQAAWIQLQQRVDCSATNGYVRLLSQALNVANDIAVDWDNLTKNSGTAVAGYWQDSPYWDFAVLEPGYTMAEDMSSAIATFSGTGSAEYRYATKTNGSYGSWSTWFTLAQLQAEADPSGITGFALQGRFISDGTQTAQLDDFAIDYVGVESGKSAVFNKPFYGIFDGIIAG